MAPLLQTLSTTSFILAVVFLALGIFLFIIFDVRAVIGELTGKTATTEIARIREQGATRQYKGRSLQSIVLNTDTGPIAFSFDKLSLEAASEQETTCLANDSTSEQETSCLRYAETTEQETTLLSSDGTTEPETTLLS
jgi:hypothetical protein